MAALVVSACAADCAADWAVRGGWETGPVSLHTTDLGDHGSRIVFCHGLFGQGRNWTQVGKALAVDHRVTLVDMPHHGRSSWPEEFDYVDVADRVARLLSADDPVTLVGHSMGGKAAMVLALRHPSWSTGSASWTSRRWPTRRRGSSAATSTPCRGWTSTALAGRADAEAALASAVPNPTVRGFLLQNLRRDGDGWRWQANLDVLGRDLAELGGWPEDALAGSRAVRRPDAVGGGANSPYVRDEYVAAMEHWFPRVRRVTVKDAGHWVHSEQPEVFLEVLRRFAAEGPSARILGWAPSARRARRPRPRCGCRTRSSRSGVTGCATGRAPRPGSRRRRRPRAGTSRRRG